MQSGKKPRVWLISSLILLVALLAACGGSGSPGTSTPTSQKAAASQQILLSGEEAGTSDISTFDPALVADALSSYAITKVFVGMIQLTDKGTLYCELCSSYSVGSDGVTWTFKLRPGLKFSDGTPLTSADVVYSINRALDPATASPVGPYYLSQIKDASTFAAGGSKIKTLIGDSLLDPDPQTVQIIAAKPVAYFLYTLTYPTSFVVEQSVIKQWGKSWTDHLADNGGQGGAGPFKVQEYTHNKQIVFVPNPNYWGPKPQLQKIVDQFFKEADTTYQVYLTNGLDDTGVPIADLPTAKTRSDYHQSPLLAINYYTMNYQQKPFDVIACRQAFALAINKDLIVQNVWKGSFIATNHIVPQGQPGYNANLKGPDGTTSTAGNPTAAKADLQTCMQQQGYASVSAFPPITLTYSSAGVQAARDEVAAMQQMWQNVLGISVKTDDIQINTLFADEGKGCANNLQFYDGPAWLADYPDPQDWTSLQFGKGVGQNGMCYGQNKGPAAAEQQQVQQLLASADVNTNSTQRLAQYNMAEQQLVNDVAWMPMEQQLAFGLRKPCVQGVVPNALGQTPPEDWANVYISTATPCAKTS
jgi:peptide/nickel transport system substrate-binding protein/oligopeptide transport system substrate-binding protein